MMEEQGKGFIVRCDGTTRVGALMFLKRGVFFIKK